MKKIQMDACFHGVYIFAGKQSEQAIMNNSLLIKMVTNVMMDKCCWGAYKRQLRKAFLRN